MRYEDVNFTELIRLVLDGNVKANRNKLTVMKTIPFVPLSHRIKDLFHFSCAFNLCQVLLLD